MTWINKHWDEEYIKKAKTAIRKLVSLFYLGLPKLIPHKMLEYREKATASHNEEPLSQDRGPACSDIGEEPNYMSLAAAYGMTDEMDIGDPAENRRELTVSQEYQSYVTAPCSPKKVNILHFWGVGDDIYGT
jgi:hypothetical protein